MLADIDWQQLKDEVTYAESDSLAEIRTTYNTIWNLPVYINAATNDPYVRIDGQWTPISEFGIYDPANFPFRGFVRYIKIPLKKCFDPLRGCMVEV